MVGMMTGLTLILSFSEGISKTIMPLFFIVCISMYWFLFEAILYVSKNGLPSNVSKKTTNILLLIIVIIIPAVYFYIV
ncbi:putative membrane protein [Enterobacter hormaechei]|nr:putative membrane protein [Enterobacter hormaechei]